MISAIIASVGFLTCYVIYHVTGEQKHYVGNWPTFYYTILISHIPLAFITPFLVIFVVVQALRNNLAKHRKFARITLPIWAYVSVTGILIYLLVHR